MKIECNIKRNMKSTWGGGYSDIEDLRFRGRMKTRHVIRGGLLAGSMPPLRTTSNSCGITLSHSSVRASVHG